MYLTGDNGVVVIAGVSGASLKVHKWDYNDKSEFVKGRACGDGGVARTHSATDWEANVEYYVKAGAGSTLPANGTIGAFSLTDAGVEVSGTGMVTDRKIVSATEEFTTIALKLECADGDAANLPDVTVVG